MASVGEAQVKLTAETGAFQSSMMGAKNSLLSLQNVAIGLGAMMAIKIGKDCVNAAMKLETAFTKVQTIGTLTEKQMAQLEKTSIKFGKSAVDAAGGLYDIYSAGHKGAKGMDILNVAMKTSVAGFTEVKGAASTIIDVMNAYGESVGDATRVSDILLKGVELGKYVFEDYAGQIGRVTSLGNQMGVEFTELIAILDVLTIKGIEFSEAVTGIRGIMNAMIKPTEDLKAKFQEWGYATAQEAIDAEGFINILQRLYDESEGNMELMGEWIPRVRGLTGFITALSGETDQLRKFQEDLTDSTGTLNDKYEIMAGTYEHQMAIFKESIESIKRDIGEGILPILSEWVGNVLLLTDAYEKLKEIMEGTGTAGKGIMESLFGISPGAEGGLALWKLLGDYREAQEEMAKTSKDFSDIFIKGFGTSIEAGTKKAAEIMIDSFDALPEAAAKAAETLRTAGEGFGKSLVDILAGTQIGAKTPTEGIGGLLNNMLDSLKEQEYIGDQQIGDIQKGIELQLEALNLRERMKDIAMESLTKSDMWGSLSIEEQQKLADQLSRSMQEYISTSDILLGNIATAISDLKLDPTIINNIYVNGSDVSMDTEYKEGGGTFKGGTFSSFEEAARRGGIT